jgi:hypothetical protein
MGTTTKQLRRVDGGISRRGEPALSEAAALGRAATPWRAVDAVNMESVNDLLATRNGCGPSYADTENLGVVLWISGWAPWDHGNGPWDDDWRYIIENGTVKRGTGDGTFPTRRPRWDAASFRILVPANEILNVLPTAALNIQWTQYKTGRGGYKIQIKDFDTGTQVYVKPEWPIDGFDLPANTLALSKKYTIKVWAITSRNTKGKPTGWVSATNTRVFTTRLSTPTNLAPVGEITTLTPTFTCNAVAKAVRYKVKIYDATGTTVLHTSIPLLLPSYPLGGGVLTDYATKKWTFTAYPDTACTAAYGVESAQVSIYKIELDDTLADGTVGTAYTGTVTATGGTGPYTYAVTSGTLPAGLSLSSGGAVSGTPTTAATSAFTVTATDANGSTGSRAYSVTVAEAAPLGVRIQGYNNSTTFAGHGLPTWDSGFYFNGAWPVRGYDGVHYSYEQVVGWESTDWTAALAVTRGRPDVSWNGSAYQLRVAAYGDGGSNEELWIGTSATITGVYTKVSGEAPVASLTVEGYTP